MVLSSIFSTLAWWEWAAYLFGFSSCLYVGIWLLWMLRKPLSVKPIAPVLQPLNPTSEIYKSVPEVRRRGKATVWISSLMLILAGYAGAKIIDKMTLEPLREVLVTAVHADGSYTMIDGFGREFETTFCHGRDDLVPGNKLATLYFRQRVGCKDVRGKDLGYTAYTHKNGTRMIFPIPKETANVR